VSTAAGYRRSPVRLVLGTGILAGTALQIFAILHGVRASWPGLPPVPGMVMGYVVEWLAAVVLATLAIELLRRYYRIATGGAVRAARAGGGSLGDRLTAWAARRWQQRKAQDAGAPAPSVTAAEPPPAVQPSPPPVAIPVVAPAAAAASPNGDTPMTTAEQPYARPPRRTPRAAPGASATWRAVASDIADFEPEDEADLARRFRDEAAGMAEYAGGIAALIEGLHERDGFAIASLGLMHDAADKVADASDDVVGAVSKFLAFYENLIAHAAEHGPDSAPHDGRFFTADLA
jgi:hypothetical protein